MPSLQYQAATRDSIEVLLVRRDGFRQIGPSQREHLKLPINLFSRLGEVRRYSLPDRKLIPNYQVHCKPR